MIVKAKCPYCGHKTEISVNQFYGEQSDVETCTNCDLKYVLNVKATVNVSTLKIEGEDD